MEDLLNNTSAFHYQVGNESVDLFSMDFTTEMTTPSDLNYTISNITDTQKATLRLYDIFIPLFGVFIIVLNLAVIISSGLILKKDERIITAECGQRQQPRSTYLFMGNVAMSDLVTGVAVLFGMLYTNRNVLICSLQIGMIVSSTLASVYSVGLIAVDRFLYILHGLQYQRWVYPSRARLCILISWLIGLIIGFLPLMGWAGDTNGGKWCWFILLAPKELIFLTIIVGSVPLLTVIILYGIILYHAIRKIMTLQRSAQAQAQNKIETTDSGLRMFSGGHKKSNVSDSETEEPSSPQPQQKAEEKSFFKKIFTKRANNNVNAPSKWKAIKVVIFTSGGFLLTWGPYFIASFMYTYCDDKNLTKKCTNLRFLIASPLAILGFLNSLINPIIYAWWHQGFRTFVMKKWDSIRKKKSRNAVGPSSKEASSTSKDTASSDLRKTSNASSTAFEQSEINVKMKPV